MATLLAGSLILYGCEPQSLLQRILKEQRLYAAVLDHPSVYFVEDDHQAGFEYELLQGFAQSLGVQLVIRALPDTAALRRAVASGAAQIALAGHLQPRHLGSTDISYPVHYASTRVYLVSRQHQQWAKLSAQAQINTVILGGARHQELLLQLQSTQLPQLHWQPLPDDQQGDSAAALEQLDEGLIDLLLINQTEFDRHKTFFPQIRILKTLSQGEAFAWMMANSEDHSLADAAQDYLQHAHKSGVLGQLTERYFGHLQQLDYVGNQTFERHMRSRLPQYQAWFEAAAHRHDLDWRLLAAIGYQESHWRARAVSPTGVKGLMMLTLPTAKDLGIDNRLDAQQSIQGGADYFAQLLARLPVDIDPLDRTWLALAAYNIGFYHLEDARRLAHQHNLSADRWGSVKQTLPLLEQKHWYDRLPYGYARGREAVLYVHNIRRYYDVLRWHFPQDEPKLLSRLQQDNLPQLPRFNWTGITGPR